MPVHDLLSILEDPHLVETDFFPVVEHPSEGAIRSMRIATTWSNTSATPSRLGPRLGEQSREILSEAGFKDEEISRLFNEGVIRTTGPDDSNNNQD
jgi:crotonobetainyl-CoA:carnitine CoA-transferase CaiB-like acyl-CoA transferase